MSNESPAAVEFKGFCLAFDSTAESVIFDDVSLSLSAGGFYLLAGESGSGKSSLLKLLAGIWEEREPGPILGGRLEVLGQSVLTAFPRSLRGRVQAVLQEEGLLDDLSPRENVELGLLAANKSKRLALAMLSRAGMDDPPRLVSDLSGGQRKRVAVARALAGDPELLIFDEPTAGLDATSARKMAELLAESHAEAVGRTTIIISHDLSAFAGLTDSTLWIDRSTRNIKLFDSTEEIEIGESSPPKHDSEREGSGVVLRRFLLEIAGFTQTLWQALLRLPPYYPGLVLRTCLRYVIDSIFFVTIGAAAIGGLATYFALRNNPLEGAFTSAVIAGSGKVLVAVLIPMLAGFFFTARIAAGSSARLGTMKRSSQVNALTLMGVIPADYLLTPMVWGMTLVMPLITVAALITASIASLAASSLVMGTSSYSWASAFSEKLVPEDFYFAAIKTMLSGFLVAIQTYYLSMGPKKSGSDVGEAVNRSIVWGIFTVLLVHSLFTLAQFS